MPHRHSELIQSLIHQDIIKNERIKKVMLATDRIDFSTDLSYEDSAHSIGYNVTISAPYMHAYALEMLQNKLIPGARVLDVGSGSGYLTACIARLVQPNGKVIGIEHISQLVDLSLKNITKNAHELLNDGTIKIILGDGRLGYPQGGPYDAIHVGAAVPERPTELIKQLKPGGCLIVPVGVENQTMMIYKKSLDDQEVHEEATLNVRYAPLTDKNKQWSY